ncbi:anti-sigma factor RsbA family regulatory protein [Streptomyces sp. NPDC058637]|uniref:anti-sigma factor RsbA family regulatory protein n=1 Tax=Streptomyces sp. NPDC058637 TaxID=3346569 RepID=UPI0036466C26
MSTALPSKPSGAPEPPGQAPAGFHHELYPYRGEEQFLTGTLGFIHEALEADEAVVVAVPPDKTSLLQNELADEPAVTFVDPATAGPNPGRLIGAWTAWLAQQGDGGRPVRGIGESAWRRTRSAGHLEELRYHEWLMNQAFAQSSAYSMLCPYDDADQDQNALRAVSRCHPLIRQDGQYMPNTDHLNDRVYPFEALLAPCDPYQEISYTDGDLAAIRAKVSQCAADAGVPEQQQAKLAVAVTEIATNSIRHGGGSGTMRTWAQETEFVCEFRDAGYIPDVMAGRIRPPVDQIGGRGLWLAHQLCDLVQIRSAPDRGTTVRLHMDIAP